MLRIERQTILGSPQAKCLAQSTVDTGRTKRHSLDSSGLSCILGSYYLWQLYMGYSNFSVEYC